ncbi:MAG: hypothetical protein IVW54_10025 [Candidatus Binataceae bacterium]|nr:hypothetical protein [Candidatus Binataceae bacterium]
MSRRINPIAIAPLLIALTAAPVCRAEQPAATPEAAAPSDERAYALYLLASYANAAAYEARILTKGSVANYYRMKVSEIDRLEYRIETGQAVKYSEIGAAIDPLAAQLIRY